MFDLLLERTIRAGYHLNMPGESHSERGVIERRADSNSDIIVSPPRAARRVRWAERVFLAALAIYAVLALLANRYAYFGWDLALAQRIQSISSPVFRAAMMAVSLIGNSWTPWALVIVAGIALISARLRVEGMMVIVCAASGWIVNRLWKLFIGRPRPSDELVRVAGTYHHESFPSGHVVFFVEFFGILFFLAYVLLKPGLLRRVSLAVLGVLILLIGISRVYLGAHWPSDVIGAYLAGGIWLMLMIEVYRRMKERELRPAARQP